MSVVCPPCSVNKHSCIGEIIGTNKVARNFLCILLPLCSLLSVNIAIHILGGWVPFYRGESRANQEPMYFINTKWCYFISNKLNLKIEYIEKCSHVGRRSLAQKSSDLSKNITYLITSALFVKFRKIKHKYENRNELDNLYDYQRFG